MIDFESTIEEMNESTLSKPISYEKRTYRVDEIQDILGIGRDAAYKLCRSGLFRVVKVGKTVRISKKSFDAWLEGNA